ncbi:uncharacterized protein LOC62_04G005936 [Vanrija pseudolonga]|uniref:Uncharacterized protein n=1 Tax=Vanrija pseudolonga TaxID=143232 RepID=A0AAF0Y9L7_9TREE|nr:hypothetical protein LOC62_04G005936 [Vanrija pseudolonga]
MAVDAVRTLVRKLTAPSTSPLLPFIPKYIKVLFLLLILANSSSFPFLWHLRVWKYPLTAYYKAYTKGVNAFWRGWRKEVDKRGNIYQNRTKIRRIALFDDCDYNMHLSNSSYPKASDAGKMKWAIDNMAPCFATGLFMALGASHWQYFKEIPIGSTYTIETRLGGYGDKVHLVTEFIIYPKGKGKGKQSRPVSEAPKVNPNMSVPPSGTDTPVSAMAAVHPLKTPEEVVKRLAARARAPRADGGVVCCLAVTDYCFKIGRITIPPRVAFHLSLLSEDPDRRAHALNILRSKDHGAAFLRGGWRDDPLADVMGKDIGPDEEGSFEWIQNGREAMELVGQGLSAF